MKPELPIFQNNECLQAERQNLLNAKIKELQIPDEFGYVIESGVIETVAFMQELGIPTRQSDEGGKSSISPWIEFGTSEPVNIYEHEEDLKASYMKEHNISPEEIDKHSSSYSREKEVFVLSGVREMLQAHGAQFTKEFEDSRTKTTECIKKLQEYIDEYYTNQPPLDNFRICITFPYQSDEYSIEIRHVPFLEIVPTEEDFENTLIDKRQETVMRVKMEFERFTEFLKNKYYSM